MTSELQVEEVRTDEWQTLCKDLKARGAVLLETQEWSDCTMLVGPAETPFKVHKLMLTMASPVFQLLFEDDTKKDTFQIADVEPEAFAALLSYIYTEKISISLFKDAHSLFLVAEKYLIPQLAKVCSDYMVVNLSMETACMALEAGMKYQDHVLVYESRQWIKLYINDILCHKSFEEVDMETVAAIFSTEDLKVEEMDLYQALLRHIKANASRKRSASAGDGESGIESKTRRSVRKALQQIRFLAFSLEEFSKGPATSGLFTKTEALAIMINIAQKQVGLVGKTDVPMPDGFSSCPVPRFKRPKPAPPPAPTNALSGTLRVSLRASACTRASAQSARCVLNNKPWVLKVLPVHLCTTGSCFSPNQLGVFLRCMHTEPVPWSCVATVEFKLLAVQCKAEDYTRKIEGKRFSELEPEHGFESFISVSLASSSTTYVRDDTITIEAHVRILPS